MENLESQIHNKDCELIRLFDIFLERDKEISKLRTENKKLQKEKDINYLVKELDLIK